MDLVSPQGRFKSLYVNTVIKRCRLLAYQPHGRLKAKGLHNPTFHPHNWEGHSYWDRVAFDKKANLLIAKKVKILYTRQKAGSFIE